MNLTIKPSMIERQELLSLPPLGHLGVILLREKPQSVNVGDDIIIQLENVKLIRNPSYIGDELIPRIDEIRGRITFIENPGTLSVRPDIDDKFRERFKIHWVHIDSTLNPNTIDFTKWMTVTEAATVKKMKIGTILRYIELKRLQGIKIGSKCTLVLRSEVDAIKPLPRGGSRDQSWRKKQRSKKRGKYKKTHKVRFISPKSPKGRNG